MGFVLAFSPAGLVHAAEANLRLTSNGFVQRIPDEVLFARLRFPTLSATTDSELAAAQLHAFGDIRGRPWPEVGLRLGLDTGLFQVAWTGSDPEYLLDGRPAETRIAETFFLGETYLQLELGPSGILELRLGKLRPEVGAGAIFDAYALGIMADLDLSLPAGGPPLSFRAWAVLPDATFTERNKQSPFLDVEAAIGLAPRTELRFLFAALRDGDDGAVPVLENAVVRGGLDRLAETEADVSSAVGPRLEPVIERAFGRLRSTLARVAAEGPLYLLETDGWLGWTGAVLEVKRPDWSLQAVALLGFGELEVAVVPDVLFELLASQELDPLQSEGPVTETAILDQQRVGQVNLLSGFGQLKFRLRLFDEVEVDTFVLLMSGDSGLFPDESGSRTYSSFVGLAPFITHTSLFFNGGLANSLASPTVASPAPDGAGLIAGGLFVDAYHGASFHVRSGLAAMASTVPSPATNGQFYGIEGDIVVDYVLNRSLLLFADLAAFVPMSYYGELPVGLQGILGLVARWESDLL